jgi:hypothetical protein
MFKLKTAQLLGYNQNMFTTSHAMIGGKPTIEHFKTTAHVGFSTDEKLDQLAIKFVKSHAKIGVKIGVKP